jgi:hypothetical protein
MEVIAFAAAGCLLLAALAWLADRGMDRSVETRPRADQRIPADELALTTLDWRDPIRPYFQRRWESAVRTRAAVNHVCGIELPSPHTNRGRAANTADPTNTRRTPDVGSK